MSPSERILSLLASLAGSGFTYFHVAYWTQPGNCSPCRPEFFARSIIAGVIFAGLIGSLWLSKSERLSRLAKIFLVALAVSVATSPIMVGLALLPIVAAVASLLFLALALVGLPHRARPGQ